MWWTNSVMSVFPFIQHEVWHQHTWRKETRGLRRETLCQPLLIHRADASLVATLHGRLGFSTPGSACLGQITKDSLHQFLLPAPMLPYPSRNKNISLNPGGQPCDLRWPQNVAEVMICNSRPGNIHFHPWKQSNRLQGKFKTSHWRERPYRGS